MLTVIAVAFGVVFAVIAGRDAVFVYWFPLPLALALLWRSTSDERFDERSDERFVIRDEDVT